MDINTHLPITTEQVATVLLTGGFVSASADRTGFKVYPGPSQSVIVQFEDNANECLSEVEQVACFQEQVDLLMTCGFTAVIDFGAHSHYDSTPVADAALWVRVVKRA